MGAQLSKRSGIQNIRYRWRRNNNSHRSGRSNLYCRDEKCLCRAIQWPLKEASIKLSKPFAKPSLHWHLRSILQKKSGKSPQFLQIMTESIGKIIAEAMEKVGKDGIITVAEAKGIETTLDVC